MGLITKAKGAPKSEQASGGGGGGGGVKYICNVCSSDVTSTVRIRCASKACHDYDLCVKCFSSGSSNLHHDPRTHPYQVVEPHSIPIYDESWGADEELLLLEGAEQYGLGSWADIADHIGGFREKDEVRDHYIKTYIDSPLFPLPERADPHDTSLSDRVPREEFQARKKRRIDDRKDAIAAAAGTAPVSAKPTSSVPSCHEVAGFMPGRLEFETEYFNDAEEAVQHMNFAPDEGINPATGNFEAETELKMVVMSIYNDRLTARTDRKRVIFNHKLLDYRKNMAVERRRTKEQNALHLKVKPFARMMSSPDFVAFSEDIEREYNLRQAIAQLQEWRRMRISTLAAGEKYEGEKAARLARNMPPLGQFDRFSGAARTGKMNQPAETAQAVVDYTTKDLPVRLTSTTSTNGLPTPPPGSDTSPKRTPLPAIPNLTPLQLSSDTSTDLQLLLVEEKDLCSKLHVQPKAYLAIKDAIFREAMKADGKLKKKNVREISKIDTTKGGRIFEFMVDAGWLANAAKS